jgi:hypothetical protein
MTEADAVDMTSLNDRPSLFSMSSRLYVSQRTLSIGPVARAGRYFKL